MKWLSLLCLTMSLHPRNGTAGNFLPKAKQKLTNTDYLKTQNKLDKRRS